MVICIAYSPHECNATFPKLINWMVCAGVEDRRTTGTEGTMAGKFLLKLLDH